MNNKFYRQQKNEICVKFWTNFGIKFSCVVAMWNSFIKFSIFT